MNEYINSNEIISRIESVSGLNRKQIASEVFDISNNNLSNRIREDRIDLYKLGEWAVNNSVNLDWLLTGQGTPSGASAADEEGLSKDVDLEVLTEIIEGVEEYLEGNDLTLAADKKARLISLLYEYFTKTGESVNQKTVVSYLKLVA